MLLETHSKNFEFLKDIGYKMLKNACISRQSILSVENELDWIENGNDF